MSNATLLRWFIALTVLILPYTAEGAEASVSIKPRVGITILGFDSPTGGVSAGLDGRALFTLQGERRGDAAMGVYAGAGCEVIGLTGGWYHMGLICGPRVGGWLQRHSLYLSAGAGALYGQLSTCRTWEAGARQCMRWWPVPAWPEASVTVAYRTEDMHIGLDLTSMLLQLPWGTDGSFGIAASGSWR